MMVLEGVVKRSEMLNLIRFVIDAPRLRFDSNSVANEILSVIEKNGMAPPPAIIIRKTQSYNFHTRKIEKSECEVMERSWEPE
jgi:hypothetical protein